MWFCSSSIFKKDTVGLKLAVICSCNFHCKDVVTGFNIGPIQDAMQLMEIQILQIGPDAKLPSIHLFASPSALLQSGLPSQIGLAPFCNMQFHFPSHFKSVERGWAKSVLELAPAPEVGQVNARTVFELTFGSCQV